MVTMVTMKFDAVRFIRISATLTSPFTVRLSS